MLLAVIALALSVALGAPGAVPPSPSPAPASQLPATQPGLGRNEGVFLITTADDGTRAVYFVAGNARHSILPADMQLELQLNPLWPLRYIDADEALTLPEGAPVGKARTGLIGAEVSAPEPEAPAPAAPEPPFELEAPAPMVAETPSTVTAETPVPVTAEAPAPVTAEAPATYIVNRGDSAFLIARQFGIDQAALLAANGIPNPNRVYVGQTLVIPGAAATPEVADDSSEPAALAIDEPQALAETPDDALADAPEAETSAVTYTVQPGDSAFLIARRFGVPQDALLAANGIANPSRVYAGQVLTIPG